MCRMAEKGGQIVPESVLKKQKRAEEWALVKKQEVAALKEKKSANRKLIYNRAKEYAKEYAAQERELIQLKREARLKGGFYVNPEAKLLFIIRIRGINAMHPTTKKILQLLRLRQVMTHLVNVLLHFYKILASRLLLPLVGVYDQFLKVSN
ncbi:60S ribosomal protein L7-4-like [Salvia hispanica]|uniref:60S ribosomal protein L7-4-like n=1 Tax=Salvia hispanica TaxID=49212 RepID=UPI0020091B03|nr:60S ribosomal protein L7-4-like [Salvia hispanica]